MKLYPVSDHDIPLLDISTRVILNKTTPRKIYQYHKANFETLNDSLTVFAKAFYTIYKDERSWNVNKMWGEFTSGVLDAMNSNIPVKHVASHKQNLPLITGKIRQEIRNRNSLFNKAKHSI